MNIYFSGIGGVGLGPLAEVARDAGHTVCGSDGDGSLMLDELQDKGIQVSQNQNGDFLRSKHSETAIDWFVHTSALPKNHPELLVAKKLGLKITKRDELLAEIISVSNKKLIAIAGTHGKTTTTGMMVWALKQLNIPVSYLVGTTLLFGPAGAFDEKSEYFVYECDEFDRNFLTFSPKLSIITSLGYDHTETYATTQDYLAAFSQFVSQSEHTVLWEVDAEQLPNLAGQSLWQLPNDSVAKMQLAGDHNRRNGTLVLKGLEYLELYNSSDSAKFMDSFPGTNRRFERLADNLYSDYGHHPTEIAATLQMAQELSSDVVLVYQPHQNVRQHEIQALYKDAFVKAQKVYWLPTYLSREDPDLPILPPETLINDVSNKKDIQLAQLDDELWTAIELHRDSGDLVLCMGAGSIDGWVRSHLS